MINKSMAKAYALIAGGEKYPDIKGMVSFYRLDRGVLIVADIYNLPLYTPGTADTPPIGPFGFHIHDSACREDAMLENPPFASCGGHFNPTNQPHGNHAGDLPVLFSMDGRAYMTFYTNRFAIDDIIGRSVVIHENPDDFRTNPAGDSGIRIAAGNIRRK